MRKLLFTAACMLMLSACGTIQYQPTEYPLRDGLIAPIDLAGAATIHNAQPSTTPVIVYSYGGSKLSSNLHAISELMTRQATKELAKAAPTPRSGPPKTIELRVDSLLSTYAGFHWNSNLKFEARLGNGQVVTRTVPHTSGILQQDLNGCIAESVMTLLNDEQVRRYLAE